MERDENIIRISCYFAAEDRDIKVQLEKHISTLRLQGLTIHWDDYTVISQMEWKPESVTCSEAPHILLSLMSADFLSSASHVYLGMQQALVRSEKQPVQGIAVIVRPIDLDGIVCSAFRMVPFNKEPVVNWPNRENALAAIAATVRTTALQLVAEQRLQEGKAVLQQQRYREALSLFDVALQFYPQNGVIYKHRGDALCGLEHYEEALDAYERAIHLDPQKATYYEDKGRMLHVLGRYAEALMVFEEGIQLDASCASLYRAKGAALQQLARYEEALQAYKKALDLCPHLFDPFVDAYTVLEHLQRYKGALALCEQALQTVDVTVQEKASLWNRKGNMLYALDRYEEAIKAYNEAISYNPEDNVFYRNKGETLALLKRYEDALQEYDKALRREKKDAYAYFGKSEALYHLQSYEEALVMCEQAIQLDMHNGHFYTQKAAILQQLSQEATKKAQVLVEAR